MKVYVMRHGQTDWNVLGKVQGCTDIELNQTGIEQAKKAKEIFNKCDIDLIISSPLKRAKKTAELVSEDKQTPIILSENLQERGFGDVEGLTPEERQSLDETLDFWNYNDNIEKYNVEPIVGLCKRVWDCLDEVKEKYSDKNIMLVTHGGTARTINTYFNGMTEDGIIHSTGFGNCEIREYNIN